MKCLPPAAAKIAESGRALRKRVKREPPPRRSLRRQAASIVAKAPHGEHALDEYERGVSALMDAEPLWPIVEEPSDRSLAWLTGFEDDDPEQL